MHENAPAPADKAANRRRSFGLWCAGLLLAIGFAPPAQAQTIKPLDVERDPNGVDLLSGQITTRLPTLSIPAAPNLAFQRLNDLVPALSGQLIAGTIARAAYDINAGNTTSEHFDCDDSGDCRTKRRNGATLVTNSNGGPFLYTEAGGGRRYTFDLQNGPQVPPSGTNGFSYYASSIQFTSGETLSFAYEAVTTSNGQVWRRPTSVSSTNGYTLTLAYQGNVYGQAGWSEVGVATIHASGNPSAPLARLTYLGNTITDLAGREWICGSCQNALATPAATTATSLRLPDEPADAFVAEAQPRTYGSVTRQNWVTRVSNDGVDTNYSYVPQDSAATRIAQVTVTGPLGLSRIVNVHNGFNVRPRVTSILDSLGRTTAYEYDNDVRPVRVVRPDGSADRVVYDMLGNITERRATAATGSGNADIVETALFNGFEFCDQPACFRPVWTRDALGRQTDYTWHADHGGMLTKLEPADANGQRRRTINEYDGSARLVRERICMADSAGNALTCGTAAERVRRLTYWGSTLLPLTETATDGTDSQSLIVSHSYDAAGRRLSTDGPMAGSNDATYVRYDAAGRKTWEIGPFANGARIATRTTYRNSDDRVLLVETGTIPNENGTILTPLGRTDTTYDTRRNPIRAASSSQGITHAVVDSSWDLRGRVLCQAQRMNMASLPADACTLGTPGQHGDDRITHNFYDSESRVTQVQRAYATPLQQNYATYTYDTSDRRTGVTDANGNRAAMRYDGHGRQTRWVFPSPTTAGALNESDYEDYGYDIVGNRTSLRKRDGVTLTYSYDALNRLLVKSVPQSASGAAGYSVHYGYGVGNQQTYARFGSATGLGVTNTYDSLGRPASATTNINGVARTLTYGYAPAGEWRDLTHPGGGAGASIRYQYDAAGRLSQVRDLNGGVLANLYFDAFGRQWATGYTTAFTHIGWNTASRLDNLNHNLGATTLIMGFGYNPAGQVVIRTHSNEAFVSNTAYNVDRAYAVNGLNQYTAAGPATFGHDANGNLSSDGATTYVYDAENRLVSASGASTATLTYDPLGRLFQTSGGSAGVTQFLHDGDALVAEYDAAGTRLRRYVHGSNAAADDPMIWYEGTSPSPRGLFADHQGSVIAVADTGGAPLAIAAYDAWGIPNQGTVGTQTGGVGRFGYTGQAWIPELGMWHYKARVYSPTLGRFLQTDPVGYEGGINLYAYVENDPVNHTDPDGQQPDSVMDRRNQAFLQAMDECEGRGAACARAIGQGIAVAAGAVQLALVPGPEDMLLAAWTARLGGIGAARAWTLTKTSTMIAAGRRLVLYSNSALPRLGRHEFRLNMPNFAWSRAFNDRVIATAMRMGNPIRDSYVTAQGRLRDALEGSVLARERDQLRAGGWTFRERTQEWIRPVECAHASRLCR